MNRRGFLAGLALAALHGRARAATRRALVLGGTGFVGPHVVQALERAGWTLTLFNRGKTNPQLFPRLEKLVGDRRGDLAALGGDRRWDVVVDTSATLPSDVARIADVLQERAGRYLLLSTTEVYAAASGLLDESASTRVLADPADETITAARYAGLRAEAERVARSRWAERAVVLRAGTLAGPGDPTDQFTYWVARAAAGGRMVVPGEADDPTQLLDVRDLADFVAKLLGAAGEGLYNVAAPLDARDVGDLVDAVREAAGAQAAEATYLPYEFLVGERVALARELPLARPSGALVDVRRALAGGLRVRPLAATARDTLAWFRSWPESRQRALRAGLSPQRESALLAAWDAR